jgi:hypothetical protein
LEFVADKTKEAFMTVGENWAAVSLETDARYFEMAASIRHFPAGELAWMPGLEHVPSTAVLQRIRTDLNPDEHLPVMEQAVRENGLPEIRLYLHQRHAGWDAALARRGFSVREEMVMIAGPSDMKNWSRYEPLNKRTVATGDDWKARGLLFGAERKAPDGHRVDVDAYIEMERRKAAAGNITMMLFSEPDGQVVASFGVFILDGCARLKNVIVRHDRYGYGFATRAIAACGRETARSGLPLIAYQLPRGDKSSLYDRMSFRHVTSCFEWKKVAGV